MGVEDQQPLIQPVPVYQSYQQQPPQQQYYAQPQPQYAYPQPAYQQTVVTSHHNDHHHHHDGGYTGALIFFILGFFFTFLWLGGIAYLKSHNKTARSLGLASVILFAVCMVILIIVIATTA